MKLALLSFDVEEFDLPLSYGGNLSRENQINTSKHGLKLLLPLLEKYQVLSTFYCTGDFAQAESELIQAISIQHEIASHHQSHTHYKSEGLAISKLILEKITGKQILGFRMPRMSSVSSHDLTTAGYAYNSSVNPTYIPGHYNNLHVKRTLYKENNLLQLPLSVSSVCRIPLFWISFHLFPLWFYFYLCKRVARKDGYIHLYFHPWEFTDFTKEKHSARYPFFLHLNNGSKMLKRFEKLLLFLKKEGFQFQTTANFLKLPIKEQGPL